ncbi:hypothetical protein Tsubulata_040592 [Turnera subulata]|uniref:Uncharacterized protein n=1 Tax=Turnera subulata TaxID=218843 RepID=A0A9Q0JPD9_9ROSI|nr:hypothetical protein Tsubulata_040592 [Turnera subulata]
MVIYYLKASGSRVTLSKASGSSSNSGLENIEEESHFKGKTVRDVFSSYLNTCPDQGSRTIRTEEAIFISLQYFQEPVKRALQKA